MDRLRPFVIPFKGLSDKSYRYDFQVDSGFFSAFPDSPIKAGGFRVGLELDKRPNMIGLAFLIEGYYPTECDRCLAAIDLPIKGEHHLVAKFSDAPEEDAEVIHIPRSAHELNVAEYIHEFICLSIPIAKSYDCEVENPPPCDPSMLDYLSEEVVDEEDEDGSNPFKDALKGWDNDN